MKRTMRNRLIASGAAGGLVLVAAVPAFGAALGGGASFPNLAYSAWCQTSHVCSYSSVGSGAGITGFTNQTFTWAASDAPLNPAQQAAVGSAMPGQGIKYFSTLVGGISIPTNINGVRVALRFDGGTLAGIFDGTITKWNAVQITRLNPKVRLPNATIVECVRTDGSGTSYNFANYLGKSSAIFVKLVGKPSTLPAWRGANIQHGLHNPGVAGCVKSNPNSIGYVDLGDAINAGLKNLSLIGHKTVINHKSTVQYVAPATASITNAISSKLNVSNPVALQFALLNSPNPGAYPITITTFVLAYSNYKNSHLNNGASKLASVKAFLNYAYSHQSMLRQFHFVALPAPLLKLEKKQLAGLK